MDFKNSLGFLVISFLTSCLIVGCTTVATTGASVVYSRHSIQATVSDHFIEMQSYRKIYLDSNKFKDTHVTITAFHKEVLLTGEISRSEQRKEIEEIVKNISDVDHIYNLVQVSQPPSSLVHMSDTWITTKIKSKFLAASDIDPSQIKVLTNSGVVYLMGILPPDQAENAVEIARTTDGVQSVVKVFSYLHVSKT